MVLLLVLAAFVGHVSAEDDWHAQYVKTENQYCYKLQRHFDRNQKVDYKNVFDGFAKVHGRGDYEPNFHARSTQHGHLGKFASDRMGDIEGTSSPRCHGMKFASRVGDYDDDGPSEVERPDIYESSLRFCYVQEEGFSTVAFQSGHPVTSSFNSMISKWCYTFLIRNVEYIEVYIFSSPMNGAYDFIFESWNGEKFKKMSAAGIEHLFESVPGYISVEQTSRTYANSLSVSVGVEGLVANAKFGTISILSATCINTVFSDSETNVRNLRAKVMQGCGDTKNIQDTFRSISSTRSATLICKMKNGKCRYPFKGTVDHSTALNWCTQNGGSLPRDKSDFDDQCCQSLSSQPNFGYQWMRAWTHDARPLDMSNDALDAKPAVLDMSNAKPVVSVFDAEGNEFTRGIFVGPAIGLEFRYETTCPTLEVAFEFDPTHPNQRPIQSVKMFPIYQQPGYQMKLTSLNVGISVQELKAMKYTIQQSDQELSFFIQQSDQDSQQYYRGYDNINFIADDMHLPNYGFPGAVNPRSHYHLGIRGALMQPDDKRTFKVTFHIAVGSGKVWLLWNGKFLINSDGKQLEAQDTNHTIVTADRPVQMRGGVFYIFDVSYLHYGESFGSPFSQLSLLWSKDGVTEVVPRRYFFNNGGVTLSENSQYILTNTRHITVGQDHHTDFRLALDHEPIEDVVIQCTAPDGLIVSPSQFSIPKSDWFYWTTFSVWEEPYFGGAVGPDEGIHCFDKNHEDHEISIYLTRTPRFGAKMFVSSTSLVSFIYHESNQWKTKIQKEIHIKNYVYRSHMFRYMPRENGYSCHIQTAHDRIKNNHVGFLTPVVGVVIQVGYAVTGFYSTYTKPRWKVFDKSKTHNKWSVISQREDESYTLETPGGIKCTIDRVAERFMDISCEFPAYMLTNEASFFSDHELDRVHWKDNLFYYPRYAQHLVKVFSTPYWPQDVIPDSPFFDNTNHWPAYVTLPLNWAFGSDEFQWLKNVDEDGFWKMNFDQNIDSWVKGEKKKWASHSIWDAIERSGECPLLDGMYPMLFSLYLSFVNTMDETLMADMAETLYHHCGRAMFFQSLASCLSPHYSFNQNDAQASIRNHVYSLTTFLMKLNHRMPQNLVHAYEEDGHFCHKDGHLVGTTLPQCACIGNGQYPDCDSTVLCGPQTKEQLDTMKWPNFSLLPRDDALNFCKNEKSLAIDPHSGTGIYCDQGFCTYWASVKSQRGLPLGVKPCETPYCVVGLSFDDDGLEKRWIGRTECGTLVSSDDDGRTWVEDSFDDSQRRNDNSWDVEDVPVWRREQNGTFSGTLWSWSTEHICISDDSGDSTTSHVIKYCVKWLCDCIDAQTWNFMV